MAEAVKTKSKSIWISIASAIAGAAAMFACQAFGITGEKATAVSNAATAVVQGETVSDADQKVVKEVVTEVVKAKVSEAAAKK